MWNAWYCFIHFQKTKLTSSQLWFNFMWVTGEFHGKIPTENQFSHDAHPLYYFVIKQAGFQMRIPYKEYKIAGFPIPLCPKIVTKIFTHDAHPRNYFVIKQAGCQMYIPYIIAGFPNPVFPTITYENIVFTFVSVFLSLMFWSLTCPNRTWRQRYPFEICHGFIIYLTCWMIWHLKL